MFQFIVILFIKNNKRIDNDYNQNSNNNDKNDNYYYCEHAT